MDPLLIAIALVLLGYLLGSIPTGFWMVKALKGIDVRELGSGSTGATNVLRAAGKVPAILVLIIDALKGAAAVLIGVAYEATLAGSGLDWVSWHLTPTLAAMAAMIGHSKSIFLKFQGGKSAATALGTLLALNLWVGLSVFAVWTFLVWSTRFVSVASMIAGISSVISMYLLHNPPSYVAYCVAGASYVLIRHKANIGRLIKGTEPRIGEKSRDLTEAGTLTDT